MPETPKLVLSEDSLAFLLGLTKRQRDSLMTALRNLTTSLHEPTFGTEFGASGRRVDIRVINGWEIAFWADWEDELRIVRLGQE